MDKNEAMARRSMGSQWEEFGAHLEGAPGRLPVEVRRSIRARASGEDGAAGVPDDLADFVELVAERSYRLTEKNITMLAEAGRSDDEIFEAAVVAAYGAADRRLRAARRSWEGR
ncbi:hypothetical protein ACIBJI_38770 [Nocardia sp. NPDC050408]|uniref:hypothetical protein n=1 Tax=unclassified Nocardia TaxID=2637762 RepID=UPI00341D1675